MKWRGRFNLMVLLFVILATPVLAYSVLVEPPKVRTADLGITFDEFKAAYNENAVLNDAPLVKTRNFNLVQGREFEYTFDPEFKINGTIDSRTGKINRIVLKCGISDYMSYKVTFKLASTVFGGIVQTLSPAMNGDERAAMFKAFYTTTSGATTVGKIRYGKRLVLDNEETLIFWAEPKK